MEHLSEPALPVPLPRPLSDPLRFYRWLLLFIVPPLWVSLIINSLLPDVEKVREAAARIRMSNNLRQLGVAVRNHDGLLPAIRLGTGNGTVGEISDARQTVLWTLLPFVQQDNHFGVGMTDQPFFAFNSAAGTPVRSEPIKTLLCPADPGQVNGYAANQVGSYSGNFQMFGKSNQTTWGNSDIAQHNIGNISDGTSNTVGFAEKDAASDSTDSWRNNSLTRYPADITDGTSDTIFVDEYPAGINSSPGWPGRMVARNRTRNKFRQMLSLRAAATSVAFGVSLALLLCAFSILPRRATNALYLRSFRNDAATGPLRIAAQAALGRAFRLSGIRDPRRRWPALIRHLLYVLFLIRYAQPKFMNLEAGRDWKARLWRSLGEARCALLDVTDLTPFVREEIDLAVRCLGFHRVLFIGDGSRTADEWRQATVTALGSPDVPPECVRVVIWADTSEGRALFRDQVRAFADRLPAGSPGLNPAAFPEKGSATDPGGDAVTGESRRTFLLANLIGVGIVGALGWAELCEPNAWLVGFILGVIFHALTCLFLLEYLEVCGSLRERVRIVATFLLAAGLGTVLGFSQQQWLEDRLRREPWREYVRERERYDPNYHGR